MRYRKGFKNSSRRNKRMKIIIGGGNGLCGSWFSRWLLDRGHSVVIIDDLSESYIENLDPRIKFYKQDCSYYQDIDEIFKSEKPDYVYSMQAHAAEILSPFCALDSYQNNLLSIVSFSNACIKHNIKKHILMSSFAIYGHQKPPFNEKTLPAPADPYSNAKLAAETHVQITKEQFGLDYSIVRAHNFQGPFVNFSSLYRNFIGIAVREALNNRDIPVFSDGLQTRAFSHVKFLCEPLEKLMYIDCPIVNLGAEKPYSIIEVANIIKNIAIKDGKNIETKHLPPRYESIHAFCEHDIAREKLNFVDNTNIEELCNDVYYWVKSQPERELKKVNYEITKNIPEIWK